MLIVGFGRIGTRTAKRCLAMEMNVLVYDPYKPAAEIKAAGCEPVADLDAALPRADFVSIHCPKTPETVGMFNAARLKRMKPTAYLINTARGGIVDEPALHEALVSGKLAGAGLDVFEQEPPPSGHSLFDASERHHGAARRGRHARGGRPHERANRAQYPERARRRADPPERHQSGRARLMLGRLRRSISTGFVSSIQRVSTWPSRNTAIMTGWASPNSSAKSRSAPSELLDEAIARTAKVDPQINAVVVKHYDYAQRQIDKGLPDGPFTGVPFLLKDLDLLEGTRTTFGASVYKDDVADHTGTLAQRFLNAGVTIFGKSSSPEFGLMPTTEPRLFGPTRNPWNLAHSSGGSSGGAAAAVAARILPVAHASDGGGSIRIPASASGVFGLKPTRARNPLGPDRGEGWGGFSCGHVRQHQRARQRGDAGRDPRA